MGESRQGRFPWSVAWLLLAIAAVGREPVVMVALGLVVIGGVVSEATARLAHQSLGVRVRLSEERVIAGEELEVTLAVENAKPLPLSWCEVRLDLPEGIEPAAVEHARRRVTVAFAPGANERLRVSFRLRADLRGAYAIGAARIRTGDWLGFFVEERDAGELRPLVVYPRALPTQMRDVPALRPLAERATRRGLLPDPLRFAGVREHRPRDARKDIHWKATARLRRLHTRVFEAATSGDVVFLVNVASYPSYWIQADPDAVETVIAATTALIRQAAEEGRQFSLITNGIDGLTHERPRALLGRGAGRLRRALELLARLSPYAAGSPEAVFLREQSRIAWGATLVCATPIVAPALAEALVRLSRRRHRLLVLSVTRPSDEVVTRLRAHRIALDRIGEADAVAV